MKNRESEEMYLETILLLAKRQPTVRSVEVAEELGYSRASVSRAVGLLQKKDYLTVDAGGGLCLTDAGRARAVDIYERHRVITELLRRLGADEALAEEDACRIEHVISDELFLLMKRYTETEK